MIYDGLMVEQRHERHQVHYASESGTLSVRKRLNAAVLDMFEGFGFKLFQSDICLMRLKDLRNLVLQ